MSAKSLLLDIWELVDYYGEDRRISNTEFRRYFYRDEVSPRQKKQKGEKYPADLRAWSRFLVNLKKSDWIPFGYGYAVFDSDSDEGYVTFPAGTRAEISRILDNLAISEERDRVLAAVTDETLRAAGWAMVHLEIRCPVCGAADGEGCWDEEGVKPSMHQARVVSALEAREPQEVW